MVGRVQAQVQHCCYKLIININYDRRKLTFYNLNPTSKLLGSPSYARIVLLARKTALAFLHHKNHCFWVLYCNGRRMW